MGFLSKFEGRMEDTVEGAAELLGGASISPVQIAKKAEKQMKREKVVGAGKQYAPTLYTVLVSAEDDARMFNYYPTLAGETETYLQAKAAELGLSMDGQPLVRFIADDQLKRGKFDIVAELVAAQIVERLRADEMARYGISSSRPLHPQQAYAQGNPHINGHVAAQHPYAQPAQAQVPATTPSGMPLPTRPARRPAAISGGAYSTEFDSLNSENIAEPPLDSGGYPYPQQHAFAGAPGAGGHMPYAGAAAGMGASAFAGSQPPATAGTNAPENTRRTTSAPVAPEFAPLPPEVREVYLYDEMRDCAYQLTGQPQRMGRESTNEIIIPDINASRVHAEIHCEPSGRWILSDLGALNGVFVNGRRIKSAPLRDADIIRIGTTELEFQDLEH